jgi:uncharacterized membrane protein
MDTGFIVSLFATFVIVIILDFVWFSITLKPLYAKALTRVTNRIWKFEYTAQNVIAAILAYLVIVAVSVYARSDSNEKTFYNGAFLGACLNALYNYTNMATFGAATWGWSTAVIDISWGAVLVGTAALVGRMVESSI